MDMMQVRRQMLMATPHEATASGNPATFDTDGVWPLKSLKVRVEPVQDLHGYDSPWPAGGGANILNMLRTSYSGTETSKYYVDLTSRGRDINAIALTAGQTYTLSFDLQTSIFPCNVSVGCGNGNYTQDIKTIEAKASGRVIVTFTPTENQLSGRPYFAMRPVRYGHAVTFDWSAANIQLELGSTATTFAPYSNICPITGWTGMTVKCTGENLITCNGTSETVNGVTFEHDGNSVHIRGANTSGALVRHTFSTDLVYKQGLVLTGVPGMKPDGLYGTTSAVRPDPGYKNADVVKGKYYDSDIAQLYSWRVYVNADYDGTPFTYTPIVANGALYTVDWADEAGTIYGGTLDVVTGELVVDRAMITIDGTTEWGGSNTRQLYTQVNSLKKIENYENDMFCDTLPVAKSQVYLPTDGYEITGYYDRYGRYPGRNWIYTVCATVTQTNELAAYYAAHPAHVVYRLQTPITYHLTPQQILSLVGTNMVFSDTNGECDVTYWVHGR